jgi:diaminohydroxyphosphoribosylaminopyrimidine deaminase/5-amino-6-(5-phosphoribosylamino)uracil reductase
MRQTRNRPYVTLKLAISADGMIGKTGAGQVRITGDAARAEVQMLRAESDAILVGIGTAISDDPELTCRLPGLEDRTPLRIVIDEQLQLPLDSKLVQTARKYPVVAVAGYPPSFDDANDEALLRRREALDAAGVEVLQSNVNEPGELLEALGTRGISSLLVEGGARTARRFLDAGMVDRILLFQGPAEIGEGGIESPVLKSNIPAEFMHVGQSRFGDDLCDEYERGF